MDEQNLNKNNNQYQVSTPHKIGMGEPVVEEVTKISAFWDKFKNFAKTRKFKIGAIIFVVLVAVAIAIAVLAQIPPTPKPPQGSPTPTPAAFPTESPAILPPLSSEAARLTKELEGVVYSDPAFSFPIVDWQITLQE